MSEPGKDTKLEGTTPPGNPKHGMSDEEVATMIAENERLAKENAKLKETKCTGQQAEKKKAAPIPDPDEQLVEITLFWDGDKYTDDYEVCVNGERILIQRGKPVKIKRKFALVIEQQIAQDRNTTKLIKSLTTDFRDAESGNPAVFS